MESKIYSWEDKKTLGDVFEKLMLNRLKTLFPDASIDNPNKKFEYWDIHVNGNIQLECKYDFEAIFTNNICIEVGQDGRDSGLMTSKSTHYAIYDGNVVYLVLSNKIKELLINEYDNKLQRFLDDKNTDDESLNLNNIIYHENFPLNQGGRIKYMKWYLIPKQFFSKICLEVGSIDNLTFKDLL